MTLLLAWLVFPAIACAAALGWGVLVERAGGAPLPGVLLAPLGFAAIICVSQLLTWKDPTAELAVPVVALGGIAGLAVGWSRLRDARPDRWLVLAAVAVFAMHAGPIVLSGEATFAGYGLLGDTSIQFLGVDYLMHHGRTIADLAPSSYQNALQAYYGTGYPSGTHTALGSFRGLVGLDVAWVYQPFLAVMMVFCALGFVPLVEPVLSSSRSRALAVALAGVPAIAYGYVLQGSIKEVGTVCMLALLGALIPVLRSAEPGWRRVIAPAIAAAASVAVISFSVAPWLGPIGLVWLYLALRRGGRFHWRGGLLEAGAFAALAALLAVPALTQLGEFVDVAQTVVTTQSETGNLLRPISAWQALPAWPRGDYRILPTTELAWIAVGVAAAAVVLGLATLLRRWERAWPLLAFLAASTIAWVYVTRNGSPWADAKAVMIASPAVALVAAIGVLVVIEERRRLEGGALCALLLGGVVWSNALQYNEASLAPHDRMSELETLGPTLAGRGPTLYPQFEEFAKHFLREGAPEGAGETWQSRGARTAAGLEPVAFGDSFELDELDPEYVRRFRSLVVRRDPLAGRPPSIYRRVWQGRYYEVWRRDPRSTARYVGSLPVERNSFAAGTPDCRRLGRLAARAAGAGARLEVAPATSPAAVFVPRNGKRRPLSWGPFPADRNLLVPGGFGRSVGSIALRSGGAFELWLSGSFGRELRVLVDGRVVASVADELSPRNQYVRLGRIRLAAGGHAVEIRTAGSRFPPGAGGTNRLLGPLVLMRVGEPEGATRRLDPRRWRSLCGQRLDWVAAVR